MRNPDQVAAKLAAIKEKQEEAQMAGPSNSGKTSPASLDGDAWASDLLPPPSLNVTYHRDGTVTIWDCRQQSWVRVASLSDGLSATLLEPERSRVERHLALQSRHGSAKKVDEALWDEDDRPSCRIPVSEAGHPQVEQHRRHLASAFHDAVKSALAAVAADHGVIMEHHRTQFNETGYTVSAEFTDCDAGGVPASFRQHAPKYGLESDDFGASFLDKGEAYKVVSLRPRNRKYPVICEREDGVGFKFDAATVRERLGRV